MPSRDVFLANAILSRQLAASTSERFFLGIQDFIKWEWDKNLLNKVQCSNLLTVDSSKVPIILDEINKLPISNKYTIIVTGPSLCGKTTFINKLKRKWDADYNKGVVEINTENLSNVEQCEKWITEILAKSQSVIIELNCIGLNMTKIIKKSMEFKTPILIIEIKATPKISYLLNCIKVQTAKSPDTTLIPLVYLNKYNKQYTRPAYSEIPCIKHIEFPFVMQQCDDLWFEYSL